MKYTMTISTDLFEDIRSVTKSKNVEILEFFDRTIATALTCDPNLVYEKYTKTKRKDPMWVIRGYYPDTHVCFKAIIVLDSRYMYTRLTATPEPLYFAKIEEVKSRKKLFFESESLQPAIAEHYLVDGSDYEVEKIKHKRVMMPKGMKPLKRKKTNGQKNKKDDKQDKNYKEPAA